MGKISRRIWYIAAMILSGIILLLNVAGIVGIWITERALANTAVQIFTAVRDVTESLRDEAKGVDQKLERLQEVSIFISAATERLSQKVMDEGLLLLLLPDEREQNLVEQASTVKEAIRPLRNTLSTGLVIYRSINKLPFVDLPAPSQDQIDQIEESVGEVQVAADRLESQITEFRSGTSSKIDKLVSAADQLTARLNKARDRMANLDARLAIAQESLVRLQQSVVSALLLASILITLLMVWIIYTQVEVLRLYYQRWKTLSIKPMSPDQAAVSSDSEVFDEVEPELEPIVDPKVD